MIRFSRRNLQLIGQTATKMIEIWSQFLRDLYDNKMKFSHDFMRIIAPTRLSVDQRDKAHKLLAEADRLIAFLETPTTEADWPANFDTSSVTNMADYFDRKRKLSTTGDPT